MYTILADIMSEPRPLPQLRSVAAHPSEFAPNAELENQRRRKAHKEFSHPDRYSKLLQLQSSPSGNRNVNLGHTFDYN